MMMELEEMEYDDWLAQELAEMGIDWGLYEESMVVEESFTDYPHHHGGMSLPVHGPPTLSEKGWEGGNELGMHATGERTPIDTDTQIHEHPPTISNGGEDVRSVQPLGMRTPIGTKKHIIDRNIVLTPGLSRNMKMLEIEDEECLCSRACNCVHTDTDLDECICTSECLEVGHGKIAEKEKLGIKYCPGIDVCLPRYTFRHYKPSTSRAYQAIINGLKYQHQGSTESDNIVMGMEDMCETGDFRGQEMNSMIAVWEEQAKMETLEIPVRGGNRDGKRQSREFTNLLEMFESGGGGRGEMKAKSKLKNTDGQHTFFKNYNFDEKLGWWESRKKQISRMQFQNSKSMMAERGHQLTTAGIITSISKAVKRTNYNIIDEESECGGGGGGGKRKRGGGGRN